MQFTGLAHVTLTVASVKKTKDFYESLLGIKIKPDDEWSFSLSAVGIPCWFVEWGKHPDDRFDETRIGLDHIAFRVLDYSTLKELENRLITMKVATKGIEKFAGKYPYIAFRDPDNIQTEFFIDEEVAP